VQTEAKPERSKTAKRRRVFIRGLCFIAKRPGIVSMEIPQRIEMVCTFMACGWNQIYPPTATLTVVLHWPMGAPLTWKMARYFQTVAVAGKGVVSV